MTTIHLNYSEAQAVASFANATDPKAVPLSLSYVRLFIENGVAHVSATDRYMIAEQSFDLATKPVDITDPIELILTPALLKALKATKRNTYVSLIQDLDNMTLSLYDGSTTSTYSITSDKFAPIDPLLPSKIDLDNIELSSSPFALNLDLLTKIGKLVSAEEYKAQAPTYTFYTQASDTDSKKPKPLVLVRANMRVLLQPNLNLTK